MLHFKILQLFINLSSNFTSDVYQQNEMHNYFQIENNHIILGKQKGQKEKKHSRTERKKNVILILFLIVDNTDNRGRVCKASDTLYIGWGI